MENWALSRTLQGHTSDVTTLAVLPTGLLASGSDDNSIKLWDASKNGRCIRTLQGHTSYVTTLAVLPTGLLASGSFDESIKLWDASKDGRCIRTLQGHTNYVTTLAVLPTGLLASGSFDDSIKLWDASKDGRCIRTLHGHICVYTLAVLPTGLLASGSLDWNIKLWEDKTGLSACISRVESAKGKLEMAELRSLEQPVKNLDANVVHANKAGIMEANQELMAANIALEKFGGNVVVEGRVVAENRARSRVDFVKNKLEMAELELPWQRNTHFNDRVTEARRELIAANKVLEALVGNVVEEKRLVAEERAGDGKALAMALLDNRRVSKIEWCTYPVESTKARRVGVSHSILVVTVSSRVPSSPHTSQRYILEKAQGSDIAQHMNGVYVSDFALVEVKLLERVVIHTLEDKALRKVDRLSMRFLIELAVGLGPYHIGQRNCHHAAQCVYNECALENYRVLNMPNRLLTALADLFGNSLSAQSHSCQSESCSWRSFSASGESFGLKVAPIRLVRGSEMAQPRLPHVEVVERILQETTHKGVRIWVIEGLPKTEQTHEVVLVETTPPFLYMSQLDKSRLIRIELRQDYRMTEKVRVWTVGPELSELQGIDDLRVRHHFEEDAGLCELHNISKSMVFKTPDGKPKLWLSLQPANVLLLVDPCEPFDKKSGLPESVIPLPKWMPVEGELKKYDFARIILFVEGERHMVGNVLKIVSDITDGHVTAALVADSSEIVVDVAFLQKVKWIGGPHACREDTERNTLWVTMKGTDPSTTASKDIGAHCLCCQEEFHTANALTTQILPSDFDFESQTGWAILRLDLPSRNWSESNPVWKHAQDESAIYQCKRSPPMCDFFSNGHMVSSQDVQTQYMLIDNLRSAPTTLNDCAIQIDIPLDDRPKHIKGPLGVGVVASPDRKHIFMAMLGLDASLLQLKEDRPNAGIMHSFPNLRAGKEKSHLRFIHMAFGQKTYSRIYALSSSLLPDDRVNAISDAIVVLDFDTQYTRVEKVCVLPLENESKAHRILCEKNYRDEEILFVTEFTRSRVVQITNVNCLVMEKVSKSPFDVYYYEKLDRQELQSFLHIEDHISNRDAAGRCADRCPHRCAIM